MSSTTNGATSVTASLQHQSAQPRHLHPPPTSPPPPRPSPRRPRQQLQLRPTRRCPGVDGCRSALEQCGARRASAGACPLPAVPPAQMAPTTGTPILKPPRRTHSCRHGRANTTRRCPQTVIAAAPPPAVPLARHRRLQHLRAHFRPTARTFGPPPRPCRPTPAPMTAPGSAPVNPTATALNQPAVVRQQPVATPQNAPAGLTENAVAATAAGAAAGAGAAHTQARHRLQRLLDFVARQEPRLRWAIGDREDGSTILVTDLAGGWVPPHVRIPVGVTLLAPGRRTGSLPQRC